jgi:hypothetical protein
MLAKYENAFLAVSLLSYWQGRTPGRQGCFFGKENFQYFSSSQ